jgi:hypothetical protein
MKRFYLQSVVIKKSVGFKEAREIANKIMGTKKKTYFDELEDSFQFRNIAKKNFQPKSFRSQQINENTTLIFGLMKKDKVNESGEESSTSDDSC